jgi:hypothetical protein
MLRKVFLSSFCDSLILVNTWHHTSSNHHTRFRFRFSARGKQFHGTYWIRGWVGPRDLLDEVAKRKSPTPVGN